MGMSLECRWFVNLFATFQDASHIFMLMEQLGQASSHVLMPCIYCVKPVFRANVQCLDYGLLCMARHGGAPLLC